MLAELCVIIIKHLLHKIFHILAVLACGGYIALHCKYISFVVRICYCLRERIALVFQCMERAEDYNNQMLYDRNKNMAKAAEDLMSQGKNVFYVVGAAHYAGEGGIIDLLEKDGYTAERVQY